MKSGKFRLPPQEQNYRGILCKSRGKRVSQTRVCEGADIVLAGDELSERSSQLSPPRSAIAVALPLLLPPSGRKGLKPLAIIRAQPSRMPRRETGDETFIFVQPTGDGEGTDGGFLSKGGERASAGVARAPSAPVNSIF